MEDIKHGKQCKEIGCLLKAKKRGYCKKHYEWHMYHKHFKDVKTHVKQGDKCNVENCLRKPISLGYCHKHYKLFKRNGKPEIIKTHGMSKYKEYSVWETMKARCYNSNVKAYKYYGARGISVCDRWLQGIENFYSDMGKRPTDKHDIDRIDSNGNYEPNNCRWATKTQNSRNRECVIMSMEKARELRAMRDNTTLSFKKIGMKFGIGKSHAMSIYKNKIWKEA